MENLTPAQVLEAVDGWTLLQINEFVESFCAKYNVSAAAPAAVAAVAAPGAGQAAVAAEQTEFTVILTNAGSEKIKVIKEVRTINPSLGLKEAKAVADSTPAELAKGVSKEEAQKIKQQIEGVGGQVEIK